MSQGSNTDLQFARLHHLEVCTGEDGDSFYRSLGNDPCFEVQTGRLARDLKAGWWWLQIDMEVFDGYLLNPCLYVDYGEGYNEADCLALPEPDDAGTIEAVLYFRDSVEGLRFDPTIRTADFSIMDARLRPMGRARAAWRLLSKAQDRLGWSGWRDMAARLGRAMRLLHRSGIDSACSI